MEPIPLHCNEIGLRFPQRPHHECHRPVVLPGRPLPALAPDRGGRDPFGSLRTGLIPLVALSRLYLGAHWPSDVLGGIAIGLVLVWLALTLYRFWDRRPLSLPLWGQLALGMAVPLILFALSPKTSMQMGAASGMVTGFTLERWYVGFPVRVALWKQVLKAEFAALR